MLNEFPGVAVHHPWPSSRFSFFLSSMQSTIQVGTEIKGFFLIRFEKWPSLSPMTNLVSCSLHATALMQSQRRGGVISHISHQSQAHVYLLCSGRVLPFHKSCTMYMVVTLLHDLIIILDVFFTLCCVKYLSKHKIDFYITQREAHINPHCITYYSEVLQSEFYAMFAWQH